MIYYTTVFLLILRAIVERSVNNLRNRRNAVTTLKCRSTYNVDSLSIQGQLMLVYHRTMSCTSMTLRYFEEFYEFYVCFYSFRRSTAIQR